jgi:hypothetical protein
MDRRILCSPLAEVEKLHILDVLEACAGNRTRAADILGISIRTLRNKLHEYKSAGQPASSDGAAGDAGITHVRGSALVVAVVQYFALSTSKLSSTV